MIEEVVQGILTACVVVAVVAYVTWDNPKTYWKCFWEWQEDKRGRKVAIVLTFDQFMNYLRINPEAYDMESLSRKDGNDYIPIRFKYVKDYKKYRTFIADEEHAKELIRIAEQQAKITNRFVRLARKDIARLKDESQRNLEDANKIMEEITRRKYE